MFDRLLKPFLTVETGEAYQPIRLTYILKNKDALIECLEKLQCIQKNTMGNSWTWYWKAECDDLHFESLDSFRKNPGHDLRLGTFSLRDDKVYLNLPSFKRACLAVSFFHRVIQLDIAAVHIADFINKVFAVDERLTHGFTELFKEEELDKILHQRVNDFQKVQEQCEHAATAEEALRILAEYTKVETHKRLPFAERYEFEITDPQPDPDVLFLGFYIFLRSRELVAIKRWFGQTGYTLADAADETVGQVFGDVGIDILE